MSVHTIKCLIQLFRFVFNYKENCLPKPFVLTFLSTSQVDPLIEIVTDENSYKVILCNRAFVNSLLLLFSNGKVKCTAELFSSGLVSYKTLPPLPLGCSSSKFLFSTMAITRNFHNEGPISLIKALRLIHACSKDVPFSNCQGTYIEFR